MGAVEVSPFGGLRQRSVLGPAVRVKYSMHRGRVYSGGRFNVVKEEPSGGILAWSMILKVLERISVRFIGRGIVCHNVC